MKNKLFQSTLVALTIMLLFVGCGSKKINMKDYTTISFAGTDGRGTAVVEIDYAAMASAINQGQKSSDSLSAIADYFYLSGVVTYSCDKRSELSNGEQITVTIDVPDDLMEKYGFKATNTEQKVKVEGLTIPEKVDAFADVNVHFSGYSPYATASVENNSDNDFLKYATYQLDKASDLKNGDTVTVSVTYKDALVDQYGYIPEVDTKEFTVEGLGSYITSYEELTDACLLEIKEDSKDRVDAQFVKKSLVFDKFADVRYMAGVENPYKYSIDMENINELTSYLLVSKGSGFNAKYANYYVKLYKTTGSILMTSVAWGYTGDMIIGVAYPDIIKNATGECEVALENAIYSYFTNEDDAYTYWMTSNKDRYKVLEIKAEE